MLNGADLDRARDALHFLDPSCPRDEWVKLAMASKAAGLAFDTFDGWSAQASNYSERDARSMWQSIRREDGIGPATLFKAALQAGWSPEGRQPRARPAKAPAKPLEPAREPRTGMGAPEVWGRCKPATAEHPYIVAKEGTPDGLRVVPEGDPLRIAGASVAGWLAVPVVPLSGAEPVSLQFVPPPGVGKKLNLPGAPIAGVFVVGDLATGATAYLCEGIGQAWACWKATGAAAVVCFGWGRVRGVAAELRQRDASARLVVVPDVGKEQDAERIARDVRGLFAMLPEGWEQNSDANDYAQGEGFDALEALLSAPLAPEQRFKLLGSADLHALPPLSWRVRGVLPAHGLASVYGPSGSGKSFLAFDMAAAVAWGCDWFGYRVKTAPVVYCALEGEAGFRVRVEAWEQAHGQTLPAGLHLVLQPFKLTDPQDVQDMAAAVRGAGDGAVTILDTLNRAAPRADENASADMGAILESAKELQRLTGGLVVLVHHTGKDATKGLRGHSSLFAALDAAVEVTREGDRKEWRIAKAKDGQDGAAHPFRLEVVQLAPDDEGEPVSSCVVRPDDSPENATRSRLPKGGNQKVVLDALGDLLQKSVERGRAGAPVQRPCVEIESAVEAIAPRLLCEPLRKKERTRQALTGLVAASVVTCREGWLWLP